MSIFDVVVNTDDLVVFAPPANVDVEVDFGTQGQRGATFYAGSGNPNDESVQENVFGSLITPIAGDIYINISAGTTYGWLYIYNPKIVGNQWDEVLRLNPILYSSVFEKTFTSGSTTISIPLTEILPPGVTIADPYDFVVTMSPINSNPTVLTTTSQSFSGANLEIVISGIKYSSSTWSNLNSETIDISLSITVV